MLALVVVAGSVFGQSTPITPYEGATHTYTVDGLSATDHFAFVINHSSTDYSASTGANFTINSGQSGDVVGTTTTLSVKWVVGSASEAASDPYYIWIRVQDITTGCYNYRHLTVTPVANAIDFIVAAVGTGNEAYSGAIAGDDIGGGSDCAVPFDFDYNSDNSSAGDNGTTYTYFRVTRVNGSASYGWTTNFSKTNGTATIQESANGTIWTAYTTGATVTKGVAANVHYFRVLVDVSTTDQLITGIITGSVELTTLLSDGDSPESDNLTVKSVPTIGTFSGN